MKKKLWIGILAAAIACCIGCTSVLAAETQYPGDLGGYNADSTGVSFVDEDGDGVCDNFASGVCGGGYGCGTGRQDGLHRGRGLRNSQCLRHISEDGSWVHCMDADSNGVCDTCGVTLPQGAGFVDADSDGICDNFSSGTCRGGYCGGTGHRGGGHGGHRR